MNRRENVHRRREVKHERSMEREGLNVGRGRNVDQRGFNVDFGGLNAGRRRNVDEGLNVDSGKNVCPEKKSFKTVELKRKAAFQQRLLKSEPYEDDNVDREGLYVGRGMNVDQGGFKVYREGFNAGRRKNVKEGGPNVDSGKSLCLEKESLKYLEQKRKAAFLQRFLKSEPYEDDNVDCGGFSAGRRRNVDEGGLNVDSGKSVCPAKKSIKFVQQKREAAYLQRLIEKELYEGDNKKYFEMKICMDNILFEDRLKPLRERQLRFREVPEENGENLKNVLIDLLRSRYKVFLHREEIIDIKRMERWDVGNGPWDIVMTLGDKEVRNYIYQHRSAVPFGRHLVVDELSEINRAMWRETARLYGLLRVFTNDERVILIAYDGNYYILDTFERLLELAMRDRSKIWK